VGNNLDKVGNFKLFHFQLDKLLIFAYPNLINPKMNPHPKPPTSPNKPTKPHPQPTTNPHQQSPSQAKYKPHLNHESVTLNKPNTKPTKIKFQAYKKLDTLPTHPQYIKYSYTQNHPLKKTQ